MEEDLTEQVSIQRYYADDHDRLDGLFGRFQQMKGADPQGAYQTFQTFHQSLKRHIAWEEGILFPIFEEKTGMRGMGPTEVMRLEHQQIKQLLALIERCLQEGRASGTEEASLLEILGAHNQKEEQILYPAIDGQLTEQERREVFARMEEVPHG